jgi:hypothetical protein
MDVERGLVLHFLSRRILAEALDALRHGLVVNSAKIRTRVKKSKDPTGGSFLHAETH